MRIGLAITALSLASASALADTVDVRFLNVGAARVVSVSGSYFNGGVYSGVLNHQFTNGTGTASILNGTRGTFCTELTQLVNTTAASFNLVNPANAPQPGAGMGADKERALQEIFYRAETVWSNQQFTNADLASGFQCLIWKIVYDYNAADKTNSLAFNLGTVRIAGMTAAAIAFANDLIGSGIDSGNRQFGLRAVVNPERQDQLVVIPLPNAIYLVGSVAPLFLIAFRRRGR